MADLTPDDKGAIQEVSERVRELKDMNTAALADRQKIRTIMDGRQEAVAELLGDFITDPSMRLPVANLISIADDSLGQGLGRLPTIKTDPPNDSDDEKAREAADKRRRIVAAYDANDKLHMKMPQIGRWLPGYGMTPVVVRAGKTRNGQPIPTRELRDPSEALPGEWGVDQQPQDVAFVRRITGKRLLSMIATGQLHPMDDRAADKIERMGQARGGSRSLMGGAVLLGGPSWSNQGPGGIEVYEYIDRRGTWWLAPEAEDLLLSFSPNPLKSRPPFYIGKRFAFSALVGQYDRAIGILAAQARLMLLMMIATEDAVFAPTIISGDMASRQWKVGRNAVNKLTPGSQVHKLADRVPFEAFSQLGQLTQELRLATRHPLTEDAISPMSFVTGRGMDALTSTLDSQMSEYQIVEADMLSELDAMMLEYDENVWGKRERTVGGVDNSTPFSETYTPNADIKGDYTVRRVYGAMAAWDETTKIIAGLQLMEADVLDLDTMRQNIDGLENLPLIEKRITANKAERVLFEGMLAATQSQDPMERRRAIAALVNMLQGGELKRAVEDFYLPDEEEAAAEEAAIAQGDEDAQRQAVAAALSRLGGENPTVMGRIGGANPILTSQQISEVG